MLAPPHSPVEPRGNLVDPSGTLVESWNRGGTLVEPWWNYLTSPARTTPELIWAATPKLSVGERTKHESQKGRPDRMLRAAQASVVVVLAANRSRACDLRLEIG